MYIYVYIYIYSTLRIDIHRGRNRTAPSAPPDRADLVAPCLILPLGWYYDLKELESHQADAYKFILR